MKIKILNMIVHCRQDGDFRFSWDVMSPNMKMVAAGSSKALVIDYMVSCHRAP